MQVEHVHDAQEDSQSPSLEIEQSGDANGAETESNSRVEENDGQSIKDLLKFLMKDGLRDMVNSARSAKKQRKRASTENADSDSDVDSSADDDDDFGLISKKKPSKKWRKKMLEWEKVVKKITSGAPGSNVIEHLMIDGFYNDINRTNIYKNGLVEIRVNGYLPFLFMGVYKYIAAVISDKEERELFSRDIIGCIELMCIDNVVYEEEELFGLIRKLYCDVKDNSAPLNWNANYTRLRGAYLNNQKHARKTRNPNQSKNSNKGLVRSNLPCKDWNKGKCSYAEECKFRHVCSECGSVEHKAVQCPTNGQKE